MHVASRFQTQLKSWNKTRRHKLLMPYKPCVCWIWHSQRLYVNINASDMERTEQARNRQLLSAVMWKFKTTRFFRKPMKFSICLWEQKKQFFCDHIVDTLFRTGNWRSLKGYFSMNSRDKNFKIRHIFFHWYLNFLIKIWTENLHWFWKLSVYRKAGVLPFFIHFSA